MAYLPQLYIDNMNTALENVRTRWVSAWQNINQAGIFIKNLQFSEGGDSLMLASTYGLQGNTYLTWTYAYTFRTYLTTIMNWIHENLNSTPTASVTMQAMIDAKRLAVFSEVRDWIGLEWAFQQVLWDQPFFPEDYAAIYENLRT